MYRFLEDKHKDIKDAVKIFKTYEAYSPVVVGTFPIDIAIEGSDIDVIMTCDDFRILKDKLIQDFSHYKDFEISIKEVLICRFTHHGFPIEIYVSHEDVRKLNSYRHLVIEKRLLDVFGPGFRKRIIELKKSGMKTEPAFAEILDLEGNPYDALLKLERLSDNELRSLMR